MKRLFVVLLMIIMFCGCVSQTPTCNKPYILVGNGCCLDNDNNNVCDNDEATKTTIEVTTTTIATTTTTSITSTTTITTSTSSTSTTIQETPGYKTYNDEKYGLTFLYPDSWVEDDTVEGIPTFNILDENENILGSVNFVISKNTYSLKNLSQNDVQNYLDSYYKTIFPTYKMLGFDTVKINNQEWLRINSEVTVQNIDLRLLQYQLETKRWYVTFTFTSTQKDYNDVVKGYTDMLKTVKVTEP